MGAFLADGVGAPVDQGVSTFLFIGAVFDDWATPQLIDGARQDLQQMIDSARIAGS